MRLVEDELAESFLKDSDRKKWPVGGHVPSNHWIRYWINLKDNWRRMRGSLYLVGNSLHPNLINGPRIWTCGKWRTGFQWFSYVFMFNLGRCWEDA